MWKKFGKKLIIDEIEFPKKIKRNRPGRARREAILFKYCSIMKLNCQRKVKNLTAAGRARRKATLIKIFIDVTNIEK
jgi:hypothetical protein